MQVVDTIEELTDLLAYQRSQGNSIGLVPTMGALHQGHYSLVKSSVEQNKCTVISIFVNPTQFNNPEDLEKYPRTLEADLALLANSGCRYIFTPDIHTIYPKNHTPTQIKLGLLEEVMEGKYRPGHFTGVMQVVERLFHIVKPDKAYFGRKDFQQVSVIRFMTDYLKLPIEIFECPTFREENGLAMSSRNTRLSEKGRSVAGFIYSSLLIAQKASSNLIPENVRKEVFSIFKDNQTIELEYFDIVHPKTLESLSQTWVPGATACIVAYSEGVRLIDNLELIPF
jgi:pantoate--beta-alanine ligase